ncbi:hypothetical protein [Mycobacteroides chelonae]|uniref:hypothetical protein n=1 Tax=Mycobacteroides chelonae TaxID=1774 RepID=UPI000695A7D2|nr:hypothetical protein [Mycobacteroides chelonae]ANA99473.1 hypothetical protein BB28_17855 [Mycobacteroides chelonae CCUG 47445]OHU14530.1 hypothetical protein BKG75_04610 [Mycobacteroides chelonae]OLT82692.1 hypothetical protein BKG56_11795 [Mycobacteroides chelonae]
MDAEAPPPEAELIERLRRELTPRLSVNRASKMAALSEARWRQIAKGYQQVDPQTRVAVRAPSETLARMAYAVSATPKQLRSAGREDAAGELELLLRRAEIERKPAPERTPEEVAELTALPPIVPVQAETATALQTHPMIKTGVPLEDVAQTLQKLIEGFERRAASLERIKELLSVLAVSTAGLPQSPSQDPVMAAMEEESTATQELRAELRSQVIRMIATANPDNADEVIRLFEPLLAQLEAVGAGTRHSSVSDVPETEGFRFIDDDLSGGSSSKPLH